MADRARSPGHDPGEGLPHHLILADAGSGAITEFREALESRDESCSVGLTGEEVAWTTPPAWVPPSWSGRGRRPTRAHVGDGAPPPVPVRELAATLPRTSVRWRKGLKGWLEAEFAWIRVWPAHRWQQGLPADAVPYPETAARRLLVEWRRDGTVKYALSNLPADTPLEQAVAWWKERWPIERGYEQLKGEVGLDHFEGRGWTGFHHHAAMTFLAYGFLALEQRRVQDTTDATDGTDPDGTDAPAPGTSEELPPTPQSREHPPPSDRPRRGGSVSPRSVAPSSAC